MVSTITEDGGWCWFQDPRVIHSGQSTYVGFVSTGHTDHKRAGEIRLASVPKRPVSRGQVREIRLDGPPEESQIGKWANDHNSPAFVPLPNGRTLALWSLHGQENCFYTRLIDPEHPENIGERQVVVVSEKSRVTYSNPIYLASEGRLYNFFRGLDDSWKPSWVWSDDEGATWSHGRILIDVPSEVRHRPYVKYVSDGHGVIHFFFTEGHPRSFSNNVYHMAYRAGVGLCDSSGRFIAELENGISKPEDASLVWASSPRQTAWVIDSVIDENGSPRLLFQVRDTSSGLEPDETPGSIVYFMATLKDGEWTTHYVAHAGPALYNKEEDYVGLACLNPRDPNQLVISTRVNPSSGKQLTYWTLFVGRFAHNTGEIYWKRLSRRKSDCLRPVLMAKEDRSSQLYWLEGSYSSYTSYALSIMTRSVSL